MEQAQAPKVQTFPEHRRTMRKLLLERQQKLLEKEAEVKEQEVKQKIEMFNNSIPELGSQLSLGSNPLYDGHDAGKTTAYPPPFKLPTSEQEVPRRSLFENMQPGKSRLP